MPQIRSDLWQHSKETHRCPTGALGHSGALIGQDKPSDQDVLQDRLQKPLPLVRVAQHDCNSSLIYAKSMIRIAIQDPSTASVEERIDEQCQFQRSPG